MALFLLSGTLGFIFYQCLAWADVPRGGEGFHLGSIDIQFTRPATRRWVLRITRVAIVIITFLTALVLHVPVSFSDSFAKHETAILLGFFWGPLFAMWINEVIANPTGDELTRGQLVAGIGLTLLFLLGSFGNETGSMLKEYTKKISNLKIGVAEVSFSDKSRTGSPGAGAGPLAGSGPASTSGSESRGLEYFAGLAEMIVRDENYLELFQRVQLDDLDRSLKRTTDPDRIQKLTAERADTVAHWKATRVTLETAQKLAGQITRNPMTCLSAWYDLTGDSSTINKHLSAFGDLFRRIQAIDSAQQIDDAAKDFVRAAILIGSDVVASAPGSLIRGGCGALLAQFCPEETDPSFNSKNFGKQKAAQFKVPDQFNIAEREPLRNCLQKSLKATEEQKATDPPRAPSPQIEVQLQTVSSGLQNFLASDGIEGRPYFVIGYASILAQLGEYEAAGAILDGWLQRRPEPSAAPRWTVAEDWFDIRARSILAAYMEEWMRKEPASVSAVVLDDHTDNLIFLREYLETRLRRAPYFAGIFPKADKTTEKEIVLSKPGKCRPNLKSQDEEKDFQQWSRLFETLISIDLTYLQARLLHPEDSSLFSDEMKRKVVAFANMDLSCIQDDDRTNVYYAQILESFARYQLAASETREGEKQDSDETKKRISAGIKAAQFGLSVLKDSEKNVSRPKRSSLPFLTRIQTSELGDTQEKLKATIERLKKAQRDLEQ
jgi:hypothetical protein